MISTYRPGATGKTLTESELLEIFGQEIIDEVIDKGTAVIVISKDEPSASFIRVRQRLGLSQEELATKAGITLQEVIDMESEKKRTPMKIIEKACAVLGIDSRAISWKKFY